MDVTLVAAVARNGTIGTGDGIPWELPRDSQHFRGMVSNHALLIGRRTFEEMIGWFCTERPIVMTRDKDWHHPEARAVVSTLDEALNAAESMGEANLMVCGGASIYEASISVATRLVLTHVGATVRGVAGFPSMDSGEWEMIHEVDHGLLPGHDYPFRFTWYSRRPSGELS